MRYLELLFSFQAIPRIVHMWYICPRRLLTGSLRKVHQRFGVCMWSLTTHWQLRNFNENPTINFNGRVYAPQYTQIVDAGLALFLSLPSITLQFWINSIIILENHKSIWYSMSVFFPGWFRMVWNIIDVRYAKKKSKKHPPPLLKRKTTVHPWKPKCHWNIPRVQMVDFPSSRFHTMDPSFSKRLGSRSGSHGMISNLLPWRQLIQ